MWKQIIEAQSEKNGFFKTQANKNAIELLKLRNCQRSVVIKAVPFAFDCGM